MPTPPNSLFITVIPLEQDFTKGNVLDRLECYRKNGTGGRFSELESYLYE